MPPACRHCESARHAKDKTGKGLGMEFIFGNLFKYFSLNVILKSNKYF